MEILYQDARVAVCIKPTGLDSEKDVPQALKAQLGGEFFTVHRLDRNVSGVMVYARSSPSAAELSRSIQNGAFLKEYLALVHGKPEETGDLQDLLWKDSAKNKVFVVKSQRKGVKSARLTYRVLEYREKDTLVLIRLYTGRSHQIRVQFASRGFPLVGDHKYGARDDVSAPMLFSSRITFPLGGQIRSFTTLPEWAEGVTI